MDSEDLIRQIMNEVMANLGKNEVSFATTAPSSSTHTAPTGGSVTRADYPLGEKIPGSIKAATGRVLADFTFDQVLSGDLAAEDFRIAPETLEMQAQVAESVGRNTLARNMRRAAELINVPDAELLDIYNALRPYRSTKAELHGIADRIESSYGCAVNAALIREAADVYEQRGRLKGD
ncbi:MAG: diol dehydratase small subunit [Arachnia sp.]